MVLLPGPSTRISVLLTAILCAIVLVGVLFIYLVSTVFKDMGNQLSSIEKEHLSHIREAALSHIGYQLSREMGEIESMSQLLALVENEEDFAGVFQEHFQDAADEGKTISGALYLDLAGKIRAAYPDSSRQRFNASSIHDIFTFASEKMTSTIDVINEGKGTDLLISMSSPIKQSLFRKEGDQESGRTIEHISGKNRNMDTASRETIGFLVVVFSSEELINRFLIDVNPHFTVDNTGLISPYGISTVSDGKVPLDKNQKTHPLDGIARELLMGFSGSQAVRLNKKPFDVSFSPIFSYSAPVNNKASPFTNDEHFLLGIGFLHQMGVTLETEKAEKKINLVISTLTIAVIGTISLVVLMGLRHHKESRRTYEAQLLAIKAIAGSAAHHITQPLTAINGYVKMLQIQSDELSSEDSSKLHDLAEKVQFSATKINDIVEKMKNIDEYKTEEYATGLDIAVLDTSNETDPDA